MQRWRAARRKTITVTGRTVQDQLIKQTASDEMWPLWAWHKWISSEMLLTVSCILLQKCRNTLLKFGSRKSHIIFNWFFEKGLLKNTKHVHAFRLPHYCSDGLWRLILKVSGAQRRLWFCFCSLCEQNCLMTRKIPGNFCTCATFSLWIKTYRFLLFKKWTALPDIN